MQNLISPSVSWRIVWSTSPSAIIGHGDLLWENAEEGTESAKRLVMIHDLAKSAAKELTDHLQQLQNGMPAVEKPVLASVNLPTRTSRDGDTDSRIPRLLSGTRFLLADIRRRAPMLCKLDP
jgi:hypothetical protein